jgi:regulatory protein
MASALSRRGFEKDEIADVLARLRREGLLNDSRLAERIARTRIEGRGLGRRRVRRELSQRGVSAKTAEAGLARALDEISEGGVLDAAARGYWALHGAVPPEARVRRLYAFLLRRGFPPSLVHERLHALWPRLGEAFLGLEPAPEDEEGSSEEP